MTDRAVGTSLLIAAGACCVFGDAAARLAYAIEKGLFHLGRGGQVPRFSGLGGPTTCVVIGLAILGLVFLFRPPR